MEITIQTIKETSVLQLKTALPALLTEIKQNGARSLAESSVFYVAQSLEGMTKDPVLSNFPFDRASFAEIVYRVIRSGTVLERAALAKHLTPKAACFFPPVKRYVDGSFENLKTVIDQVLKPMFDIVAQHFGVPFNGDPDSVAYSIVQEYGGLSLPDFLIFFERVKTGRYRLEFQHIATRGINADFLFSWLDQYVQEKNEEVEDMYQEFKNPDDKVVDKIAGERIAEIRRIHAEKVKEREAALKVAQDMRVEFESTLYESVVIEQAFKFQEFEVQKANDQGPVFDNNGNPVRTKIRQEVICSSEDFNKSRTEYLPFRVLKEGAIDRLLKKAIFEFVTFGKGKETEEVFDQYKNRTWGKYQKEDDRSGLVIAEFKHALAQVSTLKRELDARTLIEASLEKRNVKGSPLQVRRYVNDTVKGFEDSYFDEYLPYCVRVKCPPMTAEEYILSVVIEYLTQNGEPNPFRTIFSE